MLIEMFKYKQWADRRTLDAVVGIDGSEHPSPTLPPTPHCFRTSKSSTAG